MGDAHAEALVGRLVLACRRPLGEAALLAEIVTADAQVLPLNADEKSAVEAVLGAGAVPAAAKTPAGPNAAITPPRLPGIGEPATASAPTAPLAEVAPPTPPSG